MDQNSHIVQQLKNRLAYLNLNGSQLAKMKKSIPGMSLL